MTTFKNFDSSHYDTLIFDIFNSNSSFVNSLRRVIICEIETVGFRTEDYENSDIKMIENTGSLHNEFLLHRIGLIPVYTKDISSYDPTKYKFSLEVNNPTQQIINITTKDIKILNLENNKLESNELFFPKNYITKNNILITRLKPTPDGTGEKIKFEGKSSKGTGKEHIRFSPVSNICFTNKIDPKRIEEEFKLYTEENPDSDSTKLKHKFMLEESERCFHINDNGDPNIFEFTIESCGVMNPKEILIEGLNKIKMKLKLFIIELEKSLSNNDSLIIIKKSKSLMKAFDITIENETHTLGHLLQSHINNIYKEKNIFIGYMNPHPLEKKIIFRINVEDIKAVKDIFTKTCSVITKQCDTLISICDKELK